MKTSVHDVVHHTFLTQAKMIFRVNTHFPVSCTECHGVLDDTPAVLSLNLGLETEILRYFPWPLCENLKATASSFHVISNLSVFNPVI
jgi:hypothetical protein